MILGNLAIVNYTITITTLIPAWRQIQAKRKVSEMKDIWKSTLKDQKARLKKCGINNADIEFSGFWSQGEGQGDRLSIASSDVYLDTLMVSSKAAEKYPEFYRELQNGNFEYSCYIPYSHERSGRFHLDAVYPAVDDEQGYNYLQDIIDRDLQGIIDYLDDWRAERCREFYRELEIKYNNYLTSNRKSVTP